MNRTIYALCLLVVLAVVVAGCGGSDNPEVTYGPATTEEEQGSGNDAETDARPARVFRADTAKYEEILFDENGFTLYRFDKDQGSKPTCYGACAKKWPPLLTEGQPMAFAVIPSKLGTTERRDGTTQVTYFGHPLYTYVGDKSTGEVTGHGVEAFGGTWYSIHKNGQDLEH